MKHTSQNLKFIHSLFAIFFFFISINTAYPQDSFSVVPELGKGGIQGIVKDNEGTPLTGVAVLLKGTNKGTITDEKGFYEFKNVNEGSYTIVVQAVNIKTIEQNITVKPNEITTLDLKIEENINQLSEIEIMADNDKRLVTLNEIEGTSIYSGKKTELIDLRHSDANLSTNNTRQVFNKTPGISIWENDGSGIQVGIASRGLSPNRSWEFNVRQNGYDISSDPLGYPEAYYNPPMEAVAQIQLVRGSASLQFGPQFGGVVNYVLKNGSNIKKPFSFETQNTFGNYGLFNTYNALGGTKGKFSYYTYFHYRSAEGWRDNSRYEVGNGHINLSYALNSKIKLGFEYTASQFLSQQPGGLTDVQFEQNAQQSSRSRNWLNVNWNVANLNLDYKINETIKLNLKVFGLVGERNSIGYIRAINVKDTVNPALQSYNPRQIDRDFYKNIGAELRILSEYNLFGKKHTMASGLRYYFGNTIRKQLGVGDSGSGFNMNLQSTDYARALSFNSNNFAAFIENIFRITNRWSITPGVRYEIIQSDISGRINIKADGSEDMVQNQSQSRSVFLLGLGSEYKLTTSTNMYANFSNVYRPILFSDLTPSATTLFTIDPNLKDASGYNIDLGYRGNFKNIINFDLSAFYLNYSNKIGTITQLNNLNQAFQLRTNLGTSIHQGIEAYIELNPMQNWVKSNKLGYFTAFASLSFIDAKYTDFKNISLNSGQLVETNLKDKRVENASNYIHRFGVNYINRGFSLTWQISFVGDSYADANNTEIATANAQNGKIPAYEVMDLTGSFRFFKHYNLRFGINNLADARYFTRRSGGYPGPGLLPSDGRTFFVSVGAKF